MNNTSFSEMIVLVNDQDEEIGTAPKATAHTKSTPLHRGFSLYVFNLRGELLVQQRKKEKLTWGGFWSNSCCGHPRQGEAREDAARRRVREELGIEVKNIEEIADYRYRFELNGIVENEICPIFAGITQSEISADPEEIENYKWLRWSEFLDDTNKNPEIYSPWSKEQVQILLKSTRFNEWLAKNQIQLQ